MKNKITNIHRILFLPFLICATAALIFTQNSADDDIGWPRSIEVEAGKVTIYQQ